LADPRSGCRLPAPTTVAAFDSLLRHRAFATDHRPSVVLRIGAAPASKVLADWLAGSDALQVQVTTSAAWSDPGHSAAVRVVAEIDPLCDALAERITGATGTPWLARWRRADDAAQSALATTLAAYPEPTEPAVARDVVAVLGPGTRLVVSSSMPIRDVEWFSAPSADAVVLANRGANGIDGVVSTAVGVALADPTRPVVLLIGDVAFLHDSNGLLGISGRGVNLTIVAVDNGGGGIFSFLPQASAMSPERFEQLFATPHDVSLPGLAGIHGVESWSIDKAEEVAPAVARAIDTPGVQLLHVRTDRAANVVLHAELNQAVLLAIDAIRR
jgi:2-succinyl-5-enolpyruvyl-6-hydroxy-3-cyclohexene-1-carboxylate synthase